MCLTQVSSAEFRVVLVCRTASLFAVMHIVGGKGLSCWVKWMLSVLHQALQPEDSVSAVWAPGLACWGTAVGLQVNQ